MGILSKSIRKLKTIINRLFIKTIDLRGKEFDVSLIQGFAEQNTRDLVLLDVPVTRCRTQIWNTLEDRGNPFVQTIIDYSNNLIMEYKSSAVEKYYKLYQPKSASEVLKTRGNRKLESTHPLGYVFPWESFDTEEIRCKRERVIVSENRKAGHDINASYGYTDFGPVSDEKGVIEFGRLVGTYESIKKRGYIEKPYLNDGGIRGYFLADGTDWCLIITAGKHRAYALSALGYKSIPIILEASYEAVKWKSDVACWPQVRNCTFTEDEANAIVDNILNLEGVEIRIE